MRPAKRSRAFERAVAQLLMDAPQLSQMAAWRRATERARVQLESENLARFNRIGEEEHA